MATQTQAKTPARAKAGRQRKEGFTEKEAPSGFGFFLEYIRSQAGSEKLASVERKVDKLEGKVDTQTSRIDGLEGKVDAQTSRIDGLERKVDAQTSRIDGLERKVDAQTSRIDGLERKVDAQTSRIDGLERKVDKLEGKVDTQTGRIDGLERKVDAQTSRIDGLERKVDKGFLHIESRLVKVESGLDWLKWIVGIGMPTILTVMISVMLYLHSDTGSRMDKIDSRIDKIDSKLDLLIQSIQKQSKQKTR